MAQHEEIVISGDVAVLRTVDEIRRVRASDFGSAIAAMAGTRTPVLPANTVFYAANGRSSLYATHRESGEAAIEVRREEGAGTRRLTLKLPHVCFVHVFRGTAFDRLMVFCSNARLSGASEKLCRLPLKNIHHDGSVCLGNDLRFALEGSPARKIADVERHFWESVFNSDLDGTVADAFPMEMKAKARAGEDPLETWARLSKMKSFDPCGVEWVRHASLAEIADRELEGGR